MKLTIFGASGRTGALLTSQALEAGHRVTAFARRPGSVFMEHPNLKVITGDLDDTASLKAAVTGADAVFSAMGGGSLTKRSAEFTRGLTHIVRIMEQEGVKRIVYLSSIGAGESSAYMGAVARFLITRVMLAVPLADHNANEQLIRNSQLDFTLVRPGSLHDGPFTGKFRHGSEAVSIRGNVKISRADVALFMLQQVTKKDYLMKAAWLFA